MKHYKTDKVFEASRHIDHDLGAYKGMSPKDDYSDFKITFNQNGDVVFNLSYSHLEDNIDHGPRNYRQKSVFLGSYSIEEESPEKSILKLDLFIEERTILEDSSFDFKNLEIINSNISITFTVFHAEKEHDFVFSCVGEEDVFSYFRGGFLFAPPFNIPFTQNGKVANALTNHQGDLSLDAITSISDNAAVALAMYQGDLSLDAVTSISDNAADVLIKHKGELSLNGLTTLSTEVAKTLAKQQGNLSLNAITNLSDNAASALAMHQGGLHLGGLTNLSDNAASALAMHQGDLHLGGLTNLSDSPGHIRLAEKLAKSSGFLYLRNLSELSLAAADALVKHKGGYLSLTGLTTLSDNAAATLAMYQGGLDLGLTHLNDSPGHIKLAEKLAKGYPGPGIGLHNLSELNDAVAQLLVNYKGNLQLDGLTTLSDNAAATLAKHQFHLSLDGLTILNDSPGHIGLAEKLGKGAKYDLRLSLKYLGDIAAEALVDNNNEGVDLHLNGLANLSDKAATALAKHQGRSLRLDGLTSLSDKAAEALAKHQGSLHIRGLGNLSDKAAEALVKHQGDLYLNDILFKKITAALKHQVGHLALAIKMAEQKYR